MRTKYEIFYDLVDKIIVEAIKKDKIPVRWCVKNQTPVLMVELLKLNCPECPKFILNGGICDPI